MSILKKGLKGAPVARLQAKLGLTADGDFGPATEKALKDYQAANGLAADGIAGPDTFTKIGLPELVLLRKGVKGEAVKALQKALGIGADGIYGAGTAQAVKDYQAKNGLTADGIAGPATLAHLKAIPEITAATVAAAKPTAEEAKFEASPLPEIQDGGFAPAPAPAPTAAPTAAPEENIELAAAEPEEKSVWQRVKGWF